MIDLEKHAKQQEALRATIAPVGSKWNSKHDSQQWKLVEREGSSVMLHVEGTRRYKSGTLVNLLNHYVKA